MVRTGVGRNPTAWGFGGYKEIQNPKQGCSILNRGELANLQGIKDVVPMMELHRQRFEALLKSGSNTRDAQWTGSITVDDKEFVLETKARLPAGKYRGKWSSGTERIPNFLQTSFYPLKVRAKV
jgi:hypothetical protein